MTTALFKRSLRAVRGTRWLPMSMVLVVVVLAGGRLIALTVEQRAEQMRDTAMAQVASYGRSIARELQTLADQERRTSTNAELDLLLSRLHLSRVIDPEYDFELAKVDKSGARPRIFIGTRVDPLADGVASRIPVPAGFAQDLPGGELRLAIRPRTGWYPARDLAAAIALLAVIAWLLAFATHDLVHGLNRARETLAHSRQQLQLVHQKLGDEISERMNLQKSFEHSRHHDAFTGLPNRRYFMDQLDRALRDARTRRRQPLAVLLIDIDRFKLINDTMGHAAGDELMLQLASRFKQATTQMEWVLARWSRNQFAVLVFDVASSNAALDVATFLQRALQQPIELRRYRLSVGTHVGVSWIDSGLQRAEEVVREADIALSVANHGDTHSAVAYQPAMGGSAASLVSLEADLHVALKRRELQLLFQPIIDLSSQRPAGVEALLRWQHPVEGVLTPDRFLGVAEEAGLIVPITRWTIARACKIAADWRLYLPQDRDFYLSVNLSATALRDPELRDYVAQVLEDTGLSSRMLKFELTESGLMSNPGAAREMLDGLHELGIEMMLDDFGTGYSSLSYLQLFPFDYVKIDRPFVDRAGSEVADTAIAAAIVQMTGSLGLKSVAERVETSKAASDLKRMGCNYAQGYFYCPPVEAAEALQLLRGTDERSPAAGLPAVAEYIDDSPTVMVPDETLRFPVEGIDRHLREHAEADESS